MRNTILSVLMLWGVLAHADVPYFSSPSGSENIVTFDHIFLTEFSDSADVAALDLAGRQSLIDNEIEPLMKFLFGPATHRALGGPQRDERITVDWTRPDVIRGKVALRFRYKGVWILDQSVSNRGAFTMPVPLNYGALFTPQWKKCGDSDPDHATPSFFWYFWDPRRPGCDHSLGTQYDEVTFHIGSATVNEPLSYPEYERMIREVNGRRELSLTIAFGYVEDRTDPRPDTDMDQGANEYRTFLRHVRTWGRWTEEPVNMREYKHSAQRDLVIGRRFTAQMNGVNVKINVVINAGIDQMVLFAESFAHDHDAVFAWMGHSRVGDGFDARKFRRMLASYPQHYSVTKDYQLVYWGGCNSYSYYTLPFFQFKAEAFPDQDPHGTRNLDIIAHGLPSYFVLNAVNAEAVATAALNWGERRSYQQIVKAIEDNGNYAGITILAAVLGDEDNPR